MCKASRRPCFQRTAVYLYKSAFVKKLSKAFAKCSITKISLLTLKNLLTKLWFYGRKRWKEECEVQAESTRGCKGEGLYRTT